MAFKQALPPSQVPDSPEKLFLDLPRRKIPDVLPHQKEIMQRYATNAYKLPDVALQLPTGSGKTLVGLLISEWRRRKNQERVVYLCPTRQLVNQVVEQAEEKYGLTVLGFGGSAKSYTAIQKAEYRNADRIAITTYSSLFNTNPFFDDADVIVVDDAHTAESYIASLWSILIQRSSEEHSNLHSALCGVLKPLFTTTNFTRLSGKWDSLADVSWVDKVPTPSLLSICDEITEILDVHVKKTELAYSWSMIRGHLLACQLYVSPQEILIRPLIPPTWTHAPFCNPKQRIYMSATLGAGGDLERLMGRKAIHRLPVPEGWNRHGVGRRFFIFPSMSLEKEEVAKLRHSLMLEAGRSLVLVPSEKMADEISKDIQENVKFETFSAKDIEDSKKPFISSAQGVAVVANRYDGIDFPGEECRLLFIEGLPRATNIQERFLMTRMGANVLFNERVQIRVLQAIGRCTRSLEDFSAVVVSGEELPNYLTDLRRRKFLHPELQAEINFGIEQSKETLLEDIIENFGIFLKNGTEWEAVSQQIVNARMAAVQESFPAIDELSKVVAQEVEFQTKLWQGDYENALGCAETVLGGLNASELRGYRAMWCYLAGSAAWLGAKAGTSSLSAKARAQFLLAKGAATGIPWLVALSRYENASEQTEELDNNSTLMGQIENLEAVLTQLGRVHDREFAKREKEILDGLASSSCFEHAHMLLGEILGFTTGKIESDGSPDPWWLAGEICFVFEDHAGAMSTSTLDVTKARQVSSHPNWLREKVEACTESDIIPILVTPVRKVRKGGTPHLKEVALWPLAEFREWAGAALTVIRNARSSFYEAGDVDWRASTAEAFKQSIIDAPSLARMLRLKPALKYLEAVE